VDLIEARTLANMLIAKYVPEYYFQWDNAKRRNGMCDYSERTIYLSKPRTQVRTYAAVRQTIMHEIAHALNPGAGHGRAWQNQMIRWGLPPERCSKDDVDTSHLAKWKVICKFCGHFGYFMRKPRVSRSCGKCSPHRYNEKFKMELIPL
jgi:predicted SprT family Zn-dependent metalloprotease